MADLLLLLLMFSTWKSMRTAKDIGLLADRITAIHNGDLTTYLALPKDADLCRAAEELGDIQSGMEKALAERTQSERMKVEIVADGERLCRVFQNLLQNALQYSLSGSRVYLTLTAENGAATAMVRNTSAQELPEGVDFTARFVRGDKSRTDGGSGLGLSIAASFTEACGGVFTVETLADLFTAKVTFPLAAEQSKAF